jgi:hypothetical protein
LVLCRKLIIGGDMKKIFKLLLLLILLKLTVYGQNNVGFFFGGLQSSVNYEKKLPGNEYKKIYNPVLGIVWQKKLTNKIKFDFKLSYKIVGFRIQNNLYMNIESKVYVKAIEFQIIPGYYFNHNEKLGVLLGISGNYILNAYNLDSVSGFGINEKYKENLKMI